MGNMKTINILANDGIDENAKQELINKGFQVYDQKIAEENLAEFINEHHIEALIVRSATKVGKEVLEKVENLKLIIRAGVGLDNIDVALAKQKGIEVQNTPGASSRSVAELVFAHLFSIARFLHLSNRKMPTEGATNFSQLKKLFSKGFELYEKTIGIIGLGRIGKEVARYALAFGMKPIAYDPYLQHAEIDIHIGPHSLVIPIPLVDMDQLLQQADVITLHVPKLEGRPLIGPTEFKKMKPNAILINTSRGGIVDENALLNALESNQLKGAGLDVFLNEPSPNPNLLTHDHISVSPHIGASTIEAQKRIGNEIVRILCQFFEIA